MLPENKKRIVIVGAGFAGAYCAKALERYEKKMGVEVVLIDRHDYLLFYPLLIEAGTGGIETRHAVVSLRAFLPSTRFRLGNVSHLDIGQRKITYRVGGDGPVEHLSYDHLVLALGSISLWPKNVPGLRENGYEIKSLSDAALLLDRAIEVMEIADGLTEPAQRKAYLRIIVVGGNFTGVEMAGELNSCLRRIKARYPNVRGEDIEVMLFNREDRILKELDKDLGDHAMAAMRRRGVTFRFGTTITALHPDHAILANGERVDTHTVIWCAGVAPHPLLEKMPLPKDEKGYVLCEPDGRVKGFEDVWGVGDCAANPGPNGRLFPTTAQHAVREGRQVAENLSRVLANRPTKPIAIRPLGSLAMIGHHDGVAKILNMKFSGVLGWFLYRTVYLMKMPGWHRRLRMACDWTLDLIFPRDIVQRGIRRAARSGQDERAPSDG